VSTTDAPKNPIGFNRPFQMNIPIGIKAGYESANGTELIDVFTGYAYKTNLENNDRVLSLTAYDTWGLIGDRVAGTRSAKGTVSDYLRKVDCNGRR